jgi:glycerate 2-kinase
MKAAFRAADPVEAVLRHVRLAGDTLIVGKSRYRLSRYERIIVLGAGKAGATMSLALEKLLGKRIAGGLVNVKYGHTAPLKRVEINECGHPVPDEAGVRGSERIAKMAAEAGEKDLVLCVVSGGASALMPAPAAGISLADKQAVTKLLLACGANIHEINSVRKHLSTLKGGQLARLAFPATVVTLMLSDVIGDNLDVIGSGPTTPDLSTFADALGILKKYGLLDKAPGSVRRRLEQGAAGQLEETPKSLERTQNLIVGSNRLAVNAAKAKAKALGYRTLVLSTTIEGETRDVARLHAAIAREIRTSGEPLKPPACIISGGETTVTLRGNGKGGRNQEFALAASLDVDGMRNVLLLSAGTDGTDGPTDAAGAWCDGNTLTRARAAGLDAAQYLAENNSYEFFDRLGTLIRTGPTNTNVMDVRLVLVGK